ncbi:energy transducer TonB [uncultured Tenacibaculum sp.]|uniref:energy transducer TonB n=1 Tax=uncultured Tenacibaculum sp. TaxID=174713 RepID=UPI002630E23D|nr:energy transducer TonB [uncultured Tenacibaculum sp.]
MKSQKKHPRKQLEKFSTIFTQLGLVLTLFVVFITLEYETEKDLAVIQDPYYNEFIEPVFTFQKEVVVKKQKKVNTPKKTQKVVRTMNKPIIVDDANHIETVIDLPIDDTPIVDSKPTKVTLKAEKPADEETMSINNVQNTPVFRGCEGLSEEENRKCFERKIQKHIQRHFNAEIAQDLGLRSGKYKIYTQFVIDKSGAVSDVKIRAPHKKLEKETNGVVNKIPKFRPGMQNNKPVKVKYTLPITFKVE